MTTSVDGFGGPGTSVAGGAQGSTFTDIRQTIQTQANAFVAPSDVPTSDLQRLVEDAAGNRVLWTYRVSTAAWKGVQVA